MEKLDEALLALEAEIFDGEFPMTENDEFLVRALSEWSPTERRSSFASLIKTLRIRRHRDAYCSRISALDLQGY